MSRNVPELLQSMELLELVLETLPVGVWVMDRTGRIIHGNHAGQQIWSGARYVGTDQFGEYKGWWRDTGKLIASEEWAAARAISNGETSLNEEIEIECFDGTHKIILNSAMPIRDEGGDVIGGIIVNVDITERVVLEEQLRTAVNTDELTGACSRRRFFELLHEEIGRANRYQRPLSLIMFDVDRFKQINDSHGHSIGDTVLRFLSDLIRSEIRGSEHLARFGGDEFMLLLPELALDDAFKTAERLGNTVAHQPLAGLGAVTCSFGVSEFVSGESGDNLIRRVDTALYKAKSQGRGRAVVADD